MPTPGEHREPQSYIAAQAELAGVGAQIFQAAVRDLASPPVSPELADKPIGLLQILFRIMPTPSFTSSADERMVTYQRFVIEPHPTQAYAVPSECVVPDTVEALQHGWRGSSAEDTAAAKRLAQMCLNHPSASAAVVTPAQVHAYFTQELTSKITSQSAAHNTVEAASSARRAGEERVLRIATQIGQALLKYVLRSPLTMSEGTYTEHNLDAIRSGLPLIISHSIVPQLSPYVPLNGHESHEFLKKYHKAMYDEEASAAHPDVKALYANAAERAARFLKT